MGLFSTIGTVVGGYFGGPTGAAIGGAIGGSIDGNEERDYQEGRQSEANQFNSAQAQLNRDFQERMSNTAYQRAMNDMYVAGLNPMLAYSQGGASVPTGSQASYPVSAGPSHLSAAAAMRTSDAAGVSASSAASQANTAAQVGDATVARIKQEIVNLKTDNEKGNAIIENLRVEYQNLVKEGYNKIEIGNQLRATIDKIKAEIPLIHSEIFLNDARESLAAVEKKLKSLDVDAAEGVGNLGREAGQLKPLFEILRMILSNR